VEVDYCNKHTSLLSIVFTTYVKMFVAHTPGEEFLERDEAFSLRDQFYKTFMDFIYTTSQ
jgi:hypothetical protein